MFLRSCYIMAAILTGPLYCYENISSDTLTSWFNSGASFCFILIDVRDESEISTVIGTEFCQPYNMSWNNDIVQDSAALLPKDIVIIVYCGTGKRGAKAAAFLDSADYTVYNLTGGFEGWTGPTIENSNIKPLSPLTEPSMCACAVSAASGSVTGNISAWFDIKSKNDGSIHISTKSNSKTGHQNLLVIDLKGDAVFQKQIPSENNFSIISPALPHGSYIILFSGKNHFHRQSVIVK